MRIVAGKYKSRVLKTLKQDSTRPTLDKVKEAIFSKIGPYFDGGIVLDLFAGCGAIGLECLSRGMDKAIMVDNNYQAVSIIKDNIKMLDEKDAVVYKMDYRKALLKVQDNEFDLIYLDPPYHLHNYDEIIAYIDDHNMLKHDGYLIAESLKEEVINPSNFIIEKEVVYGIMKITYMRYE